MMRQEKDSLGVVEVPKKAYWGAQTQRSLENFKIGTEKMPQDFIHAFALLKKCAAISNMELGALSKEFCHAIVKACNEIMEGKMVGQFPLVIWQTGSGTQTNMNLNEVIANRANEILGFALGAPEKPVHPNDHVNYGQSSNDSFPTAIHMAICLKVEKELLPELVAFVAALEEKSYAFQDIIKVGRTHLQDATPVTLGQEFLAYAAQITSNVHRIKRTLPYALPQGGTAVGTGLNAKKGFDKLFAQNVAEHTKLPFVTAQNKFEVIGAHDALVNISGALNVLAVSCFKITNDIRWLASGPRCGLGEINLPANEPGSSIMPGKVNPTQCEALSMVCAQVMGNHVTVTVSGSQGNFELNVYKPVIMFNILQSITLLKDSIQSFRTKCVEGITANKEKIKYFLDHSLMLVTALNPHIGYEKASKIAKKAFEENLSLKEAARSFISEEAFEKIVDPSKML